MPAFKALESSGTVATRLRVAAILACFMMSLAACGGGSSGSGSGGGGGAGDGGGDDYGDGDNGDGSGNGNDAIEPTLASIQEHVFTPICTQCHTGATAPEGLRLEEGMAYGMLVNVPSSQVPELVRVEPGNPDDSYIVRKLEGTAAVGDRMPQGGPYLPSDTIAAIRQWISDGAEETAGTSSSSSKTSIAAAWPVDDMTLDKAPNNIVLIADGELDASLLHAESVQVFRLDDIDPVLAEPRRVNDVSLQLTSLAPTVINLSAPETSWTPGLYEVRLSGGGAFPVADRMGRIIDGDGDGLPGGDFVLQFSIGE